MAQIRQSFFQPMLLWSDFQFRVLKCVHDTNFGSNGRHLHEDFYEVVFVQSGEAVHMLVNQEMPVSAGDVFLIHPNMAHNYHVKKTMTIYNILFSKNFLDLFRNELSVLPNFQLFFNMHRVIPPGNNGPHHLDVMHLDSKYFPAIIEALDDICMEEEHVEPASKVAILSDFLKVMLLICRHSSPHSEEMRLSLAYQISQLMAVLDKQYAEEWSLSRMASFLKVSESSFRQQFKQMTHESPMQYLLVLRLRKAAVMLLDGERSISELALDCGFSDSNYFARQFRQMFHKSPREYRELHLQYHGGRNLS